MNFKVGDTVKRVGPIEWVNIDGILFGFVNGFKYARIDTRGPWSTLWTGAPYKTTAEVGKFKTLDDAKRYAEGEATDLVATKLFEPGLK